MGTSAKKTNTGWANSLNTLAAEGKPTAVNGKVVSTSSGTKTASSNVSVIGSGKYLKKLTCRISDRPNRTATAEWEFNTKYKYVDYYSVIWQYYTPSNNKWNDASETGTKVPKKFSTYQIPANADRAKCKVTPVQKKKAKINGKTKTIPKKDQWKASTSTSNYADIGTQAQVPDTPSGLNAEIIGNQLTCKVENYKYEGAQVKFQVVQDGVRIWQTKSVNVKYGTAAWTVPVPDGHKYRVRCIGVLNGRESNNWSDYTSDVTTAPGPIPGVPTCETLPISETDKTYRVKLTWQPAPNVTNPTSDYYVVEYTKNQDAFDLSPTEVQTQEVKDAAKIPTQVVIIPSEEGTWYFRVRGVNSNGDKAGEWSEIVSSSVGQPPAAPTTWSYRSSVKIGEPIIFNWTHNSIDGSKQTDAFIHININGIDVADIQGIGDVKTYSYPTDNLQDGSVVLWKVKTKGAHPDYGEFSVEREVKVYTAPTVTLTMTSGTGVQSEVVNQFPLHITIDSDPDTQNAISMDFTITSNDTYNIADDTGVWTHVGKDDVIYNRRIDNPEGNTVTFDLSPGDLDFANDTDYTAAVIVYMNSGLQATATLDFHVELGEDFYDPDATVTIDFDTLSAAILPFCKDDYGAEIKSGLTLAVYRRNSDGTFTEIMSDIPPGLNRTIYDPHPALDYARYRVVAKSDTTGQISFYDVPSEEVNVDCIVMQWDEEWSYLDAADDDEIPSDSIWTGNMIILPYNVDVSDSNNMDVSLVEYIGREHPVSYYGTQKGYSSNWKCDIRKDETELLYNIRRLARYGGDVYVREPNGTGYWANVRVQYTINHKSPTISVNFDITRVEGGA